VNVLVSQSDCMVIRLACVAVVDELGRQRRIDLHAVLDRALRPIQSHMLTLLQFCLVID